MDEARKEKFRNNLKEALEKEAAAARRFIDDEEFAYLWQLITRAQDAIDFDKPAEEETPSTPI